MICKHCAVAGDVMSRAKKENYFQGSLCYILTGTFPKSVPVETMSIFNTVALVLHGLCKGCDCQHKVGRSDKYVQASDEE